MCSVPVEEAAAERARWLGELSEALNEAHRLLIGLDLSPERRAEVRELHLKIEAAWLEVQSLRLSRMFAPRQEKYPEWSKSLPWQFAHRSSA